MAFLQIKAGKDRGAEFELTSPNTRLGRHPSCEVVVDDHAVSRRHAVIEERDGVFFIMDLKSRNGTQLNGSNVTQQHRLSHCDEIQICDTIFSFNLRRDESNRNGATDSDSAHRTSVITEFVDDLGTSASSIRQKIDLDSSYQNKDHSISHAKLRTMIDITRQLSQTLVLDEVIPRVLESLFQVFSQADRAFIVLCKPDGELGRFWAQDREGRETTLKISKTIIKAAIESKEAFLSEDAFADQRFDLTQSIAGYSIRSVMCAPLLNNAGDAIGCLQIDTMDSRRHFAQFELDLLATVAMQAGISVENARMHEEALDQRALDRDLQLAREVQFGLLPKTPPIIQDYEFYDYYEPANKVGGDFFDYISIGDDGTFHTVIADVAGHGIASALLMAKFSAEVRFAIATEDSPSIAVRRINNSIIQLGLQRFITMALVKFDSNTGKMTMVNAGHMDPIIRDANGIRRVGRENAGLPIGIIEDFEYKETELELPTNSTVILYTDGICEAMDQNGVQFGNDRVEKTVQKTENLAASIGECLIQEVKDHEYPSPDNDDICLVCIRRNDSYESETDTDIPLANG